VAGGSYLAVARFQKPHGLKGEFVVFPLTDEPDTVFVPGRALTPVDAGGRPVGQPVVIERARAYHRRWLFKLAGIDERTPLEGWHERLLGLPRDELTPPAAGQMYYHELPGSRVVAHGAVVGVVRDVARVPGGELLLVDAEGRELLIPFRRPILKGLDRERREIEIDPPPGLLEL
jgi:16S rRNA processing protein RimM